MNKTDFFVTLPSNSSMQYFPGNKTTCFTTQLSQNIKLTGSWEVALTEIIYPCTFYNINERKNKIRLEVGNSIQMIDGKPSVNIMHMIDGKHSIEVKQDKIKARNYENVDEVLHQINAKEIINKYVTFSFNKAEKRVETKIIRQNLLSVKFLPQLALQLGYSPFTDIYKQKNSINHPNLNLGIPTQLYVYCDIIEPQLVGDVVSPLLRIIPVDTDNYNFGSNKTITYTQPHYIPILRNEFSTVEIDLRLDDGGPAPFQFGTLCVKLHFKRRPT